MFFTAVSPGKTPHRSGSNEDKIIYEKSFKNNVDVPIELPVGALTEREKQTRFFLMHV